MSLIFFPLLVTTQNSFGYTRRFLRVQTEPVTSFWLAIGVLDIRPLGFIQLWRISQENVFCNFLDKSDQWETFLQKPIFHVYYIFFLIFQQEFSKLQKSATVENEDIY